MILSPIKFQPIVFSQQSNFYRDKKTNQIYTEEDTISMIQRKMLVKSTLFTGGIFGAIALGLSKFNIKATFVWAAIGTLVGFVDGLTYGLANTGIIKTSNNKEAKDSALIQHGFEPLRH